MAAQSTTQSPALDTAVGAAFNPAIQHPVGAALLAALLTAQRAALTSAYHAAQRPAHGATHLEPAHFDTLRAALAAAGHLPPNNAR